MLLDDVLETCRRKFETVEKPNVITFSIIFKILEVRLAMLLYDCSTNIHLRFPNLLSHILIDHNLERTIFQAHFKYSCVNAAIETCNQKLCNLFLIYNDIFSWFDIPPYPHLFAFVQPRPAPCRLTSLPYLLSLPLPLTSHTFEHGFTNGKDSFLINWRSSWTFFVNH